MGIHWSLPMLQTLLSDSLLGRLSQTYTDPHNEPPETDRYRIYHGGTGEVIKEIPLPRTIRVSRGKMQRLLLEEMPVEVSVWPMPILSC